MWNMTGNRPKSDTTHLLLLLLQQLQDMKMKLDLKVTVTYKNGKVKVKWISKSISLTGTSLQWRPLHSKLCLSYVQASNIWYVFGQFCLFLLSTKGDFWYKGNYKLHFQDYHFLFS